MDSQLLASPAPFRQRYLCHMAHEFAFATISTAVTALPEAVWVQNFASAIAQLWNVGLAKGGAKTLVQHNNMTTQFSSLLEPKTQGSPLPC